MKNLCKVICVLYCLNHIMGVFCLRGVKPVVLKVRSSAFAPPFAVRSDPFRYGRRERNLRFCLRFSFTSVSLPLFSSCPADGGDRAPSRAQNATRSHFESFPLREFKETRLFSSRVRRESASVRIVARSVRTAMQWDKPYRKISGFRRFFRRRIVGSGEKKASGKSLCSFGKV